MFGADGFKLPDGTTEDNEFVQKMRVFIRIAPAWKPAFDNSLNKAIESSVLFDVEIKRGEISITDKTK